MPTSSDLTPERLAELRKVAEAATPGPWRAKQGKPKPPWSEDWYVAMAGVKDDSLAVYANEGVWTDGGLTSRANAEHIAALSPPTVFSLITEVERLREALKRHGTHEPGCWSNNHPHCSCGWNELERALVGGGR